MNWTFWYLLYPISSECIARMCRSSGAPTTWKVIQKSHFLKLFVRDKINHIFIPCCVDICCLPTTYMRLYGTWVYFLRTSIIYEKYCYSTYVDASIAHDSSVMRDSWRKNHRSCNSWAWSEYKITVIGSNQEVVLYSLDVAWLRTSSYYHPVSVRKVMSNAPYVEHLRE